MYINVHEFYGDIANDLFAEDFGINISLFKVTVVTEPEDFDIRLLHENYRISKIMAKLYGGEIKDQLVTQYFKRDETVSEELRFLDLIKAPYELKIHESVVAEVDVIRDKMLLTSFMTICNEYDFPSLTRH